MSKSTEGAEVRSGACRTCGRDLVQVVGGRIYSGPESPVDALRIYGDDDKGIAAVSSDGVLTFGDGFGANDAAEAFIAAVRQMLPEATELRVAGMAEPVLDWEFTPPLAQRVVWGNKTKVVEADAEGNYSCELVDDGTWDELPVGEGFDGVRVVSLF
jgi:hypothetical protein